MVFANLMHWDPGMKPEAVRQVMKTCCSISDLWEHDGLQIPQPSHPLILDS